MTKKSKELLKAERRAQKLAKAVRLAAASCRIAEGMGYRVDPDTMELREVRMGASATDKRGALLEMRNIAVRRLNRMAVMLAEFYANLSLLERDHANTCKALADYDRGVRERALKSRLERLERAKNPARCSRD